MGSRAAESLRRSQALSSVIASTFKSRTRTTTQPLCLHHTFSSQQCPSARKENHKEWQNDEATISGVLCLKSTSRSTRYYSEIEKICYAIVMSTKKLHHYLETHTIRVLTNQPLNDIFGNRDSSGQISKGQW
jgi:hypothetical protein